MEDMKKRRLKPRRGKDYGPDWPNGEEQRKKEEPRRKRDRMRGQAPYDADTTKS